MFCCLQWAGAVHRSSGGKSYYKLEGGGHVEGRRLENQAAKGDEVF